MRTKLDNRIRVLIENGIITKHRSMFAVVGPKARDQVTILHHILAKATVGQRPNVLWCYKKELGFSSRRQNKMKKIKKKAGHGNVNVNESDPFEMFVASTNIRYCYYSESHKILGNTYGMVVLQDFEALTPNMLARTIETVEGGGLVVLLMSSVNTLKQLFTMTMDIHTRYRTDDVAIVPRFNERFILSLSSCKTCIVTDDKLNILPISSHVNSLVAVSEKKIGVSKELLAIKESVEDTKPIGDLVKRCKTKCQAKALLTLLDVITAKGGRTVCSMTAARGRGKSAALGLAIAGAIGFGYGNIFVTSPSPENLKTLFEFVVLGLKDMGYEEHGDYELVQSSASELGKAVVKVTVKRDWVQTIQYISPSDAVKLGQAELVVIDEAAAIPLPLVNALMDGDYIVFLASTINGYEGTGRSLSLKLLAKLREQAVASFGKKKSITPRDGAKKLYEVGLEESIRYNPGDHVESWLNRVLCLDSGNTQTIIGGAPSWEKCQLYYVNRDTLFSYHKASEGFLNNLVSIYAAAHYKNSPNDLQVLSDAPNHHIFVLMAPVTEDQTKMPDILVMLQVCYEGNLSKDSILQAQGKGRKAVGDLIPWTVSQQFMDHDFPQLLGGRIVRIAVHPDYQSKGYGKRAIQLLTDYYEGKIPITAQATKAIRQVETDEVLNVLEENISPRDNLPSLLLKLNERPAEKLDYLGVSYGLTVNLLKFWKRSNFVPVFIRQSVNELTDEHTIVMLKSLNNDGAISPSWLINYWEEFKHRYLSLLGYDFKSFSPYLSLSLIQRINCLGKDVFEENVDLLKCLLTDNDLQRLRDYGRNLIDNHLVADILPGLAMLYLKNKLGNSLDLKPAQIAVFIGLGLQYKSIEDVAKELDVPVNQLMSRYSQTIRSVSDYLDKVFANDCTEDNQVTDSQIKSSGEPLNKKKKV
uniref:RNA cytidine acetyltransferase n=1 Tax=Rhabditophanes sp. KR3021 TaxID=114890 RepID=A0AC35TPU2_9BILA